MNIKTCLSNDIRRERLSVESFTHSEQSGQLYDSQQMKKFSYYYYDNVLTLDRNQVGKQ